MARNRHYVTNFMHIFVEIITVDNVDKSVDSLYMGIICSHFVHISSTLLYYGNFIFVSFHIMCPEQYFGKTKKYENFSNQSNFHTFLYYLKYFIQTYIAIAISHIKIVGNPITNFGF